MPKVSIILPTYKDPIHINKSISSIIAQSFSDWELIIVDDGLSKNARSDIDDLIGKDPRVFMISNPENLGIQKTLNIGISTARGKYIARIDDDDQWIDKDKLKRQVEFLDNNLDYILVGTDGIICDENFVDLRNYSMPKSDLEIRNRILFKNCFLHSSVLIRKNSLDNIYGYAENKKVRHVEDYDLWLRLGCVGKICNLDIKAVRLIVSANSITSKNRLTQARRDIILTIRYRNNYPYFYFAVIMSCLRLVFFCFNQIFPIPKKILFKIQTIYKAI